jgi:hypothetical protein
MMIKQGLEFLKSSRFPFCGQKSDAYTFTCPGNRLESMHIVSSLI